MMGVKRNFQKGLMSQNQFFKECLMTLLTLTPVFPKKMLYNLIFVIFDVRFLDGRHILDNCSSQTLPLDELTTLINISFCNYCLS